MNTLQRLTLLLISSLAIFVSDGGFGMKILIAQMPVIEELSVIEDIIFCQQVYLSNKTFFQEKHENYEHAEMYEKYLVDCHEALKTALHLIQDPNNNFEQTFSQILGRLSSNTEPEFLLPTFFVWGEDTTINSIRANVLIIRGHSHNSRRTDSA